MKPARRDQLAKLRKPPLSKSLPSPGKRVQTVSPGNRYISHEEDRPLRIRTFDFIGSLFTKSLRRVTIAVFPVDLPERRYP
jgi:hypothetical protein